MREPFTLSGGRIKDGSHHLMNRQPYSAGGE
jgi:hypothetical protein